MISVFVHFTPVTPLLGRISNLRQKLSVQENAEPGATAVKEVPDSNMNYDTFYMKQNQVYKPEIFQGEECQSGSEAFNQFYLSQENEIQDAQPMYSEIVQRGVGRMRNRPSSKPAIESIVKLECWNPGDSESIHVCERDAVESCKPVDQPQREPQWLYTSIPECELSVYDLPHERVQEGRCRQAKQGEGDVHEYDIPEEKVRSAVYTSMIA